MTVVDLDRHHAPVTEAPAATLPGAPEKAPTRLPISVATGRLRALDVLRGLAVVGMILVNNQGSGAHAFWGMAHADWNGWSPADLVFPTFLFVVGGSMALSTARRPMSVAKAVKRAALLFGIGLALNGLPPTRLADVRWMGVLQRIGLCFLVAFAVIRWLPRRRQQMVVAGAALAGYWVAVAQWPMTPARSLPGLVDRLLLGPAHVYRNGFYDPEGLASTIPATVTVLIGYWALTWLRSQPRSLATARRLFLTGLGLAAAGHTWGIVFPINKRLWTSSYVLLSGGIAVMLLAAVHVVTELRPSTASASAAAAPGRAALALEIFGTNALVMFAASDLLTVRLKVSGERVWLYDHIYAPALGFRLGSLAYGLVLVALWWLVAWAMWRRRIFVKV